jgi:hypothetical protein
MLSVNVVYAVLLAMSIQDLPAGHCAGAKCCLVSMRLGPKQRMVLHSLAHAAYNASQCAFKTCNSDVGFCLPSQTSYPFFGGATTAVPTCT